MYILKQIVAISLIALPVSLPGQPEQRKTVFDYAADGDLAQVKTAIDLIGMADIYDSQGKGLLHSAAAGGQIETIDYLIHQGLSIHTPDRSGYAPIHYAIASGMSEGVLYLIRRGALSEDPKGMGYPPLLFAIEVNQINIARILLLEGADPSYLSRSGVTPMHRAASIGNEALLKEFLDAFGYVFVNILDANGRTPMHHAAAGGHPSVIHFLVQHEAQINVLDDSGQTPLRLAYEHEHADTVYAFLCIAEERGGLSFEMRQILKLIKEGVENIENLSGFLLAVREATQQDIHGLTLMDYIRLFNLEDRLTLAALLEASPAIPGLIGNPNREGTNSLFIEGITTPPGRTDWNSGSSNYLGSSRTSVLRHLGRTTLRFHANEYDTMATNNP